MQSATIPVGPRNPNGYTEEEVLRAIRGVDGTRELSWRFELLDQQMNYKRDLEGVLGGNIQMHYISEIKRTADFEIRGEEEIDWLFDQIKPYTRIKMPPRIIQDGIILDTLWQNSFDGPNGTPLTPENSGDYGDPVSSIGDNVSYSTVWSRSGSSCQLGTTDGSGGGFGAGRITFNFRARRTWRACFYLNVPATSNAGIWPNGLTEDASNFIQFDDVFQNYRFGSIDVSSIKDNLFGQPIKFEILDDGLRRRYSVWWTDIEGATPDFVVSEDSSQKENVQVISISGGGFNRPASRVDDIRVGVPNGIEYLPRTQSVWENNFNGSPDEFVDTDSLRYFGSIPSDINGYLAFNDEWSAAGEASLQLGESGSGSGSIQANVPPRDEWSLRMYANIPEGGKLYIAPSPEDFVPAPEEAPPWVGPISRNGTSGSSDWNFTTTTAVPAGTDQGDFMLAVVTTNETGNLSSDPSWNLITFREIGEGAGVYVFTKIAGPDEPEHYQWTFDVEHWHSAMISSWKNVSGLRQLSVNVGEEVMTVSLPVQGAIAGDAMLAIGFDWQEVNKTWSDSGFFTPELHQARGLLASSRQGLSTGPTPTYDMTTTGTEPSRMAAITAVLAHVPDPNNLEPYPGPIQYVGHAVSTDGGGWTDVSNIPVPDGTSQGDYMVAVLTANFNDELTPAAGWDFLGSQNMGTGTTMFLYGRFASVSEPASYQWDWNGEHWHSGACTTWRNTLGPRSVNLDGDEGINSIMLPSAPANDGDALIAIGFDWGDNAKEFVDDDELTEILNQSGNSGTLQARQMSLSAGMSPSYEFTSNAPAPTRMTVAAVILEAFVDQSGEGQLFRGPNWIVLDDEGGEYSIAGTDVSNPVFVDQLFGTPIRIEIETDGSSYSWRVYSTDPFGNAPDINWYGDSSSWGPMRAFLFQGGGDSVDPTLIDEVTIGRMIPVDRPSPPEVNYVEFPMGVFMLASPTRDADDDDVVIREVEAYDRTKLFIDDKLTEPFAIKKGELYTPIIDDLIGDIPKIVEPSEARCGRDREFSIGTSKKEVIDRIAEGINYHTLRFDEEGRAVVQPYVNPTNRSPEYDYYDNEVSIMYPDVSVEFDAFDIANVWITSVSEGDSEPIYVKLENHDPANPFSIPRRGRRIVDFREEEEVTDRTALLRKAKRLQFEANRLYETVSFNTLINPLHSANDCYNVRFGPLGVNEKYTEINWEIPLEAGATMTHTARRVVKLDAAQDEGFIENHLEVIGSLTAGNIKWGIITIPWGSSPSTHPVNVPVSVTISGLDLKGSGPVQVFVTPSTTVPGSSVRQVSSSGESPDGFQIWAVRRTAADSSVYWMAMRNL